MKGRRGILGGLDTALSKWAFHGIHQSHRNGNSSSTHILCLCQYKGLQHNLCPRIPSSLFPGKVERYTKKSQGADPKMPQLPVTWNLTAPLNLCAYTNGSYSCASKFPLEFADPKRYAQIFAYGRGNPYSYGFLGRHQYPCSSSTRTTSSIDSGCHFCNPVVMRTTMTSSTPTPMEDITTNPPHIKMHE